MWEEDLFDWDSAKGSLFLVYFCVILPVSLSLSPNQKSLAEVAVAQEFRAYRLQQFDVQGNPHGSRGWRVSFEAAALGSKSLLRRCLVLWWKDLLGRSLEDVLQQSLGAALVVIPKDLDTMPAEEQQSFLELEEALVAGSFGLPVYLIPADSEIRSILASLEASQKSEAGSAFSALINAVTADAFHFSSEVQSSSATIQKPLLNLVGRLSPYQGRDSDLPVVAVVAHYDSFGASPALSYGVNSDATGAAAVLEIARVFHKLYQNSKSHAKYNLVFLLSSGGKLNYQGARQWIDEQLEQHGDGFTQLELAVCLEGLGLPGSTLSMHVSRAPKEGSKFLKFYRHLVQAAGARFGGNRSVAQTPKKVNLADEFLGWEHERFSIRRLPGFTLSQYESPRAALRNSVLDRRSRLDSKSLYENTVLIADALVGYLYGFPENETVGSLLAPENGIREDLLASWMDVLGSTPRGASLLAEKGEKHAAINTLYKALDSYTLDARKAPIVVDKKDPEFVLYGVSSDKLMAHNVKPAVFDLLLAALILAYLGLLYVAALNIHTLRYYIQGFCQKLVKKQL